MGNWQAQPCGGACIVKRAYWTYTCKFGKFWWCMGTSLGLQLVDMTRLTVLHRSQPKNTTTEINLSPLLLIYILHHIHDRLFLQRRVYFWSTMDWLVTNDDVWECHLVSSSLLIWQGLQFCTEINHIVAVFASNWFSVCLHDNPSWLWNEKFIFKMMD